jgi:hypothetical protein
LTGARSVTAEVDLSVDLFCVGARFFDVRFITVGFFNVRFGHGDKRTALKEIDRHRRFVEGKAERDDFGRDEADPGAQVPG